MSTTNFHEYTLKELIELGEFEDIVYTSNGEKKCKLRVKPLYSKEENEDTSHYKEVKNKYLLTGKTDTKSFEVVVSDKYVLIPNNISNIIKDLINGEIDIKYWSGMFFANVINDEKGIGVQISNSYVKTSSFKIEPLIKITTLDSDFYMRIPIVFSKDHLGTSELVTAFLANVNQMLEKIYNNKNILITELNKEIPEEDKLLLDEKISKFFNKRIKNLYFNSTIRTYTQFIYFFSEQYKEALKDKNRNNLRTEILRQLMIDECFKNLEDSVLYQLIEDHSEEEQHIEEPTTNKKKKLFVF